MHKNVIPVSEFIYFQSSKIFNIKDEYFQIHCDRQNFGFIPEKTEDMNRF